MEFDLRNEEGAKSSLVTLDAFTLNAIFEYCKTRGADPKSFTAFFFGDGDGEVELKIGRAAQIAERLEAVVHLSHGGIPITCYPTVRDAALAGYRIIKDAVDRGQVEMGNDSSGK